MKKLIISALCSAMFVTGAVAQTLSETSKGAGYQVLKQGGGQKVKVGDVAVFDFTIKTDKDSVLQSSVQTGTPAKIQVQDAKNARDIVEASLLEVLPQLSVNDSAIIKVPADSMFAGHEEGRPSFFPKGSSLNFILKVKQIQTVEQAVAESNAAREKMEAERNAMKAKFKAGEAAATSSYLNSSKLAFKTTPSGLKYIVTKASAKRKPLKGDTVMVNYVGRTLDGKIFDTSIASEAKAGGLDQPGRDYEPIEVVVGAGRVIQGWDEGLLLLNEDSKATFFIPSRLAYGENAPGPEIKPYSPLVFDVELVKVKPGPRKAAVAAKKPVSKSTTTKKAPAKKPVVKKKVTSK